MNGFKFIRENILKCSVEKLANEIGVSRQTIYMWENGKKEISVKRLLELEELTGIPKGFFMLNEVSRQDIGEMRKHHLKKEIDEVSKRLYEQEKKFSWMEAEESIPIIEQTYIKNMLWEKLRMQERDLRKKIERVLWGENEQERSPQWQHSDENIIDFAWKVQVLSDFVGIVGQCDQQKVLEQLLKAMSMYFGMIDEKNYEEELVSDLISVLQYHKKKKIDLLKKELAETKRQLNDLDDDNY